MGFLYTSRHTGLCCFLSRKSIHFCVAFSCLRNHYRKSGYTCWIKELINEISDLILSIQTGCLIVAHESNTGLIYQPLKHLNFIASIFLFMLPPLSKCWPFLKKSTIRFTENAPENLLFCPIISYYPLLFKSVVTS